MRVRKTNSPPLYYTLEKTPKAYIVPKIGESFENEEVGREGRCLRNKNGKKVTSTDSKS